MKFLGQREVDGLHRQPLIASDGNRLFAGHGRTDQAQQSPSGILPLVIGRIHQADAEGILALVI